MAHQNAGNYKGKHAPDVKINEIIGRAVNMKAVDGKISCDDAGSIADELSVTMQEIGVTIDLLEISLNKCQLGLFGYGAEKKIVEPAGAVNSELERSVREAAVNGRLPCEAAWKIAERLNISKMAVSAACEDLKIKIKPCQLGAF